MEIKGYPNYLIYPDGRVWSKKGKGKFLKPADNSRGYLFLYLSQKNIKKHFYLHRLVAEHYIPNPSNKPQVDHINRIRNDNRVENLRWVNQSENNLNMKLRPCNTTGHKNITFRYDRNKYVVGKSINGKNHFQRQFKNKTDAICYKYIMLLKIKSNLLE